MKSINQPIHNSGEIILRKEFSSGKRIQEKREKRRKKEEKKKGEKKGKEKRERKREKEETKSEKRGNGKKKTILKEET